MRSIHKSSAGKNRPLNPATHMTAISSLSMDFPLMMSVVQKPSDLNLLHNFPTFSIPKSFSIFFSNKNSSGQGRTIQSGVSRNRTSISTIPASSESFGFKNLIGSPTINRKNAPPVKPAEATSK